MMKIVEAIDHVIERIPLVRLFYMLFWLKMLELRLRKECRIKIGVEAM